ncbi:MAG: V-type ATP synthase subunit E family protein [Chloroflexota bacterium]
MEKLSSAILEKVKAEADSIIKEAEAKAKASVDAAKSGQQARFEAEKVRLGTETDAEIARIKAQSAMKARQELLAAKTEVVNEILERAKQELARFAGDEKVLASLAREGITSLNASQVRVYVSPRNLATMQRLIKEVKELSAVSEVKSQEFLGGVVVETMDGKNRIDNTFETRLEMLLPRLMPEIGRELFRA